MNQNPIAAILGFSAPAHRSIIEVNGEQFLYIPATKGYVEGLYRHPGAFARSNACFSITPWQNDGASALAGYLHGRDGLKRAAGQAVIARAIQSARIVKEVP